MQKNALQALAVATALVAASAFLILSPGVHAGTPTSCGNGVVDQGEECDDGNNDYEDGCSGDCVLEGACCSEGGCFLTTSADCSDIGSYHGDGSICTQNICDMMLVTLDSVSAKAVPGGVLVRWTTTLEIDTIGFRVLREDPAPSREKRLSVVVDLLPSAGHGLTGATYEVFDDSPASQRAAEYYLEDIDIFGKVTRHGPIVVDRGARQIQGGRAAR